MDSWKDSVESKDGSTLSTIGGSLMQIEQLRKYYRDSSPDSYLSRKGGEKDQLAEFLIKASGLEEQQNQNQKVWNLGNNKEIRLHFEVLFCDNKINPFLLNLQ